MTKTRRKRYWYKYTHTECVLCGAGGTPKQRMYTKPPQKISERHIYEQFACGQHFV
jgi:hypothetical protein